MAGDKDLYLSMTRVMNPSSDMCIKCLIVGHLPTKSCGVGPCCFVLQVNNISLDHSMLFNLVRV